jgi:DNA repair protein RadC
MAPPSFKAGQTLRIQELPERDRPRERLRRLGPEALSSPELLALLLGTGGAGRSALLIAHDVLARSDGSWRRLAEQPVGSLAQVPGVGRARATAIVAALELGRRLATEGRDMGVPLRAPSDVVAAYAPRLEDLAVEEFHVAVLDVHHRLERDILVTRGLLNTSLVHPREVFRAAVAERAAGVVLVHNHPSGDPTPSPEDRLVTAQMAGAGELLGIPVLDHVIIGRGRYASFRESGLL